MQISKESFVAQLRISVAELRNSIPHIGARMDKMLLYHPHPLHYTASKIIERIEKNELYAMLKFLM